MAKEEKRPKLSEVMATLESAYPDAHPRKLMEAAACGRPLVATDAPGCREICIANQTGLLVPIEDPPALANAILTLAQSQDLRARLGAAARRLVEDKLSARIIGRSIVELYNKLTRQELPRRRPASLDQHVEMREP